MGDISIDKASFSDRLSGFITQWKNDKRTGDAVFNGVNSLFVCVGKANEATYSKTAAFQLWLLGYEFPATLIVVTPDAIHFVTTKKKAVYLEPLKGGKIQVEVHVRSKDPAENTTIFEKCIQILKDAGKKVGVLGGKSEKQTGPFVDEWDQVWGESKDNFEEVEMSGALSAAAFAVKDEKELRAIRDASRASSRVLGTYFVGEMSNILDEEKKIGHDKLAEKVSSILDNDRFWTKQKISNSFDTGGLDWAVNPVIQSGGDYDLKFVNDSTDRNLHAGVIIAGMGLRYNTYSSFVARTYLVDPSKAQESNYKTLLNAHNAAIKAVRDGAPAKDVYKKALAAVESKDAKLAEHFLKSVGYGIGIEVQDAAFTLGPKSTQNLKDGMTLVVLTGFTGLENKDTSDKRSKVYSLVLADTIRVTDGEAAVFTKDAASDSQAVAFFFEGDEEPTPKKSANKRDARIGAVAQRNITSSRLRNERQQNHDAEKESKRREHQLELHERNTKAGQSKYPKGGKGVNGNEEKRFKRFEAYRREDEIPSKVKDLGIVLDTKNSTIVLPIMGRPVPFHVNTIKNASTSSEGEFTSLRINFLSPGQGVGRKDDLPFEDPNAQFVRSLTYRSKESSRMDHISSQLTELKKSAIRREQEKKQMEDVVEQDKLILDRRGQTLDMVFLRPAFDSKRIAGTLQLHQNGVRYMHGAGNDRATQVDVLFNNVKHFLFQPTKGEAIVLVHFHLINPILIGKKKTRDVQFYREASDIQFDETGVRKRKHRHGDEDEFQAEQEERRRRQELDKMFSSFSRKVEEAARDVNLKVDVPKRELGFNGVPSRSNVLVQPTPYCLVQLTESPFMVITLEDIEIVHLERVAFGLKNFDMVIVFKDFHRPVQHVNTIPMESIDAVKDWLDSQDLSYYEGNLNLQWGTIMKTVQEDPHEFFKTGGWNFLSTDSDSEDGGSGSEEESAFEISGDDFDEDESSDEGSDFSEVADDDEDDAEMSDVSDAPSWDELERKAANKDSGARYESEEDKGRGGGKKRKR